MKILKLTIAAVLLGLFFVSPVSRAPVVKAQSTSAKSNHISNMRAALAKVLEADLTLQSLVAEAADNQYTFADGDFQGSNAGITASNYNTAVIQATNWTNALRLGVAVGGGASATLPSGLRAVFSKVAK